MFYLDIIFKYFYNMGIYYSNFPMRFDVLTAVLMKNQIFWDIMYFSW